MTDVRAHSAVLLAERAFTAARDADGPVLAQAHTLLLDALACAAAAMGTDMGRLVTAVPYATDSSSPNLADQAAALANLIHLEEFDALHDASATCPALVVAAAVQLGVRDGRTLDAVLRAIVAGAAVTIEAGLLAGGPSLYGGGIWPSSLFAALGAAAVSAYLLDFSTEQTAHALSITALSRGSRLAGEISEAHYLSSGTAVRHGLDAAWRAQQGMHGPLGILDEGPFALSDGLLADRRDDVGGLEGITFKRYPCARPLHAVADGLRDLVARHALRVDAVESVEITLPSQVLAIVNNCATPTSAGQRRCSVSYVARLALVGRAGRPEGYRELADDLPAIPVELRERDAEIDELYPRLWPARIRLRHRDAGYELVAGGPTSSPAADGTQAPPVLEDKWSELTAREPWNRAALDITRLDSSVGPEMFPPSLPWVAAHGH
jgi:2-methylcitrate dehydratase PrpD